MTGRMSRLLLAGSLALNVFLVGAAAGGAYVWLEAGRTAAGPRPGLRFAASGLPAERREAFRAALSGARRAMADQAAAGRDRRRELHRLLERAPLDRPAIDAALAAIRASDTAIRTRVEAAAVDFAASLNDAERAKLIEGLEGSGPMLRGTRVNRRPGDGSAAADR
ncbi:periplasmic heavy metal sensor [Aureimonas leprariae]|uniref:Periplasmic heavy metal sensor n=1 Tax=Plantimonas leprariae TaxID=2615207 RepID=A0A7V7PP32_9HYPH|nr:periplasmic heavy metal sensor [Aureimonas leprariae]KAB0679718.1 periplasmic heavy metal sensor [Aureimonas leprariae]